MSSRPKFSYNSVKRKENWSKIPIDTRNAWINKIKDLIRSNGEIEVEKLVELMGVKKWQVLMLLGSLLDDSFVIETAQDENGRPSKVVHWEKHEGLQGDESA